MTCPEGAGEAMCPEGALCLSALVRCEEQSGGAVQLTVLLEFEEQRMVFVTCEEQRGAAGGTEVRSSDRCASLCFV